jgi:hypothetical protein
MNTSKSHRALLVLLALLVLAASWFNPATERARIEVQGGLERALTVFAAARALGAVVSVAQGTQVAIQPAGVGVGLAPGQALQPLNHLIDQFAEVMLVASVSFGIQLLLLSIGTHWVVSALVSLAVCAVIFLRWKAATFSSRWLQPLLVLLLVIRFAVPLSVLGNEALYRWFMADEFRKELTVIQQSPTTLVSSKDSLVATKQSFWERLMEWRKTPGSKDEVASNEASLMARFQEWLKSLPDVKAQYDAILEAASEWSRSIVKLIAYFVVQTILFPIAFLWLVWFLAKLGMRAVFPADKT